MTQPDRSAVAGMSIGAVFDLLRPDFPEVTISKIRFLEEQGLVTPERTGSGYRRFTAYDCARLRFILSSQRDQYLPLKVIKAQLDAQPDGELPATGSAYGVPTLVPDPDSDQPGGPADVAPAQIRLSREDLLQRSGIKTDLLAALVKSGVIIPGPAGFFDRPTCSPPGPIGKAGGAGARDRADELAREVAALAITLHTSLIKSAVRDVLDR
ncbi:MerR family transcriptional regulator [Mycolicibacterium sp. CBMA 361]|uniref:transcriptional regulator FtsR n=1 Tax=Mycolicibacterium sp. CBMA 361 TaxID=2606610 RepID=UPI0012DF503C|nr:MerR family transcriptional regulator [Mycolicibacterium sp. CBMA 361]MUM34532.1 MerR family transcriptional regulator [Mycolicibacterium sp. CBMA 361]